MSLSRRHTDPDDRWHCCEFWQRSLANKWNAREFARKHGCRVPEMYWCGRRVGRIPFDDLPSTYVLKSAFGKSGDRVYVMRDGTDVLHQRTFTATGLRAHLRGSFAQVPLVPILIEEFMGEESSAALATDYKVHVFGDVVGAIEVVHKLSAKSETSTFYTPTWGAFDYPFTAPAYPAGSYEPPPPCLDEMLRHARALGVAYGTFVRADFYATRRGCVFGEFSTTPNSGNDFSDEANRYLGALWQRHFPDAT
ncbi:MAG TPA: ATP-grasp fold amidoligase family protein [Candidatus Binatia bacterium]|jgi:hypothetical protein